jgi:hypothetical protein
VNDPCRRLSKEEFRARWRELRTLWNEYDPIGVVAPTDINTGDEYESYIGPVLRCLRRAQLKRKSFPACAKSFAAILG